MWLSGKGPSVTCFSGAKLGPDPSIQVQGEGRGRGRHQLRVQAKWSAGGSRLGPAAQPVVGAFVCPSNGGHSPFWASRPAYLAVGNDPRPTANSIARCPSNSADTTRSTFNPKPIASPSRTYLPPTINLAFPTFPLTLHKPSSLNSRFSNPFNCDFATCCCPRRARKKPEVAKLLLRERVGADGATARASKQKPNGARCLAATNNPPPLDTYHLIAFQPPFSSRDHDQSC